jgi:hypothetical protein
MSIDPITINVAPINQLNDNFSIKNNDPKIA